MNKGKNFVSAIILAAITMASCPIVMADGIDVVLNGQELYFDVPPLIINDSTMVPVRAIFEALGADVNWNNETRTVTSVRDGVTVTLTIDQSVMYVNGTPKQLEAPACIIDERTLVPLRAVSEAYGADVVWDGNTRTVYITSGNQNYVQSPFQAVKEYIINNGTYSNGTYIVSLQMSGTYFYLDYNQNDDTILCSLESPTYKVICRILILNDGTDPVAGWTFNSDSDISFVAVFDHTTQKFTVISNNSPFTSVEAASSAQELFNSLIDFTDAIFQNIRSDINYSDFGIFKISSNNIVDATGNSSVSSNNTIAFSRLKNIILDNGTVSQDGYAVLRYINYGDILYYYLPQDDVIKILVTMDDSSSTMVTINNDGSLPTVYNIIYTGSVELHTLGSFSPEFNMTTYDYGGMSYEALGDTINGVIDDVLGLLDLDLQSFAPDIKLNDFGISYDSN